VEKTDLAVIEFVGPAVLASDGGISYRARVDGKVVACRFSAECLEDADPALTMQTPMSQFESSMSRLLKIAEKKIRAGQIEGGVVHIFTADL
jgi:hypothetical protein